MGIEEMIKVMQAYYDGCHVMQKDLREPYSEWEFVEVPQWDWNHFDYQIMNKK